MTEPTKVTAEWRDKDGDVWTFSNPTLTTATAHLRGGGSYQYALAEFATGAPSDANLRAAFLAWHRAAYVLQPDECYPPGELPRKMAENEVRALDGSALTFELEQGHGGTIRGLRLSDGHAFNASADHPDSEHLPATHPSRDRSQYERLKAALIRLTPLADDEYRDHMGLPRPLAKNEIRMPDGSAGRMTVRVAPNGERFVLIAGTWVYSPGVAMVNPNHPCHNESQRARAQAFLTASATPMDEPEPPFAGMVQKLERPTPCHTLNLGPLDGPKTPHMMYVAKLIDPYIDQLQSERDAALARAAKAEGDCQAALKAWHREEETVGEMRRQRNEAQARVRELEALPLAVNTQFGGDTPPHGRYTLRDLAAENEARRNVMDRVRELESQLKEVAEHKLFSRRELERRVRELEAHELEVARIVGIYYATDGAAESPGPRDAVLDAIAALKSRAEEAEDNYRFMVERACDEKLDGYRELGARAAEAENNSDDLRAQLASVTAQRDRLETTVKESEAAKESRALFVELIQSQVALLQERVRELEAPLSMLLHCPGCMARHVDEGEFATKPHHTHACQSCGFTWRPALRATVGVQFLPGFKNEPPAPDPRPSCIPDGVTEWTQLPSGLACWREDDPKLCFIENNTDRIMQRAWCLDRYLSDAYEHFQLSFGGADKCHVSIDDFRAALVFMGWEKP